ncbi:MAG TPA: hypothetical protein VK395_28390 [Gemmataceae bacterium]|nr:hypothetical protein [Gemmataceae bacterium]
MASQGRRTKLTPQLLAEITKRIAAGNDPAVAAQSAGIANSTFYRWLARGRRARRGQFRAFYEAIRKAESDAEVQDLAIIRQAMLGGQVLERVTRTKRDGTKEVVEKFARADWTAAAWHAERKHAERWGKKESEKIAALAREIAVLRRELRGVRE